FAPDREGPAVPPSVMLWQTDAARDVRKFEGYSSHSFLPDGRMVTTSSEHLRLWDAGTGEKVLDLPVPAAERDAVTTFLKGWSLEPVVAVAPDGKAIAALTRESSDAVWSAQVVR